MRSPVPLLVSTLLALAGCSSPYVVLQYPDATAEGEGAELTLYALVAETDCAPLMLTGKIDTWITSTTSKVPLGESVHLGRVPRGATVFFGEVRDAAGTPYLRGCVKGSSGGEVVVPLQRILKPIKLREGEVQTVELTTRDATGKPLALEAVDAPEFVTFDWTARTMRVAPGPADQGTHVFKLQPTEMVQGAFVQGVSIEVEDVPRPLKWDRLYRGWHGRFDAAALYDPVYNQLIVSGGRDVGVDLGAPMLYTTSGPADVLSDFRALDLSTSPATWNHNAVVRASTSGKFGHVMGYVKFGGRRYGFVLGGSDGSQVSPESLLIDIAYISSANTPSALNGQPIFLTGMSAASEPDESQTYVFGGDLGLGTFYNDVRRIYLSPNETSLTVENISVPVQSRPPGRTQAAMVLALNPKRLVVIGGRRDNFGTPQLLSDAYVLCLEAAPPKCPTANTWQRIINTGDTFPGSGSDGVFSLIAGYDAPRDRVVTYGGLGVVANQAWLFEDAFELDLAGSVNQGDGGLAAAFHKLPAPSDGGLYGLVGAAVAPDIDGGRLLLYGGVTGRILNNNPQLNMLDEVWQLGLTPGNETLTKVAVTGIAPYPTRRVAPAMTSRPPYVMFGGEGEDAQPLDEWRINNDGSVTQVMTPGVSPWPRSNMGIVYNNDLDEHWLYGGRIGTLLPTSSMFRLQRDAGYTELEEHDTGSTPTDPRFGQCNVYDQVNHRMVIFGGIGVNGLGAGGSLNDVKVLTVQNDTLVKTVLMPTGGAPAPRYGAVCGYDKPRERMILFGGTANVVGSEVDTRDVWELSLKKGDEHWQKLTPRGIEPDALYLPVGVLTKEDPPVMYILGTVQRPAQAKPSLVDALWKLKLAPGAEEWISVGLPEFRPRPRIFPGVVYDDINNRLLLAAGAHDPIFRNDVWALTLP